MPVRSGFPSLPSPAAGFVDPRGIQGNQTYVATHEFYSFLTGLRSWNPSLPIISATNYNLKADGVTNEAGLVQSLFDTVRDGSLNPGFTGGLLVFPPGKIYLGSTSVTSNYAVTMTGAGQGFTQAAHVPTANANATWFMSDKTSGNVFEFHTKNPVHLSKFGMILPHNTGNELGTGIYIDKYDPAITAPPDSVAVNFCSTLRDISVIGAAYGIKCLDIGVMLIDHCFVQNYIQIGIWLVNDAEAPDNGDSFVCHNHTQCAYTNKGIGLLMESMGGMAVHDNKILGGKTNIELHASVAGTIGGEVNIHHNNLEASSTNCIRVTQTGAAAQLGGLNIHRNHIHCGILGSADTFQSAIAFIDNGSANYIFRGEITNNDIMYVNGSGGGHVGIDFQTGADFMIAKNRFAIPASAVGCVNFGSRASNVRYIDNGPFTGVTVICGANAGTDILFVDRNGVPFTGLPPGAKDGSEVYVTDGRATSTSDYTLIDTGSGLTGCRIQNGWYASHPFVT